MQEWRRYRFPLGEGPIVHLGEVAEEGEVGEAGVRGGGRREREARGRSAGRQSGQGQSTHRICSHIDVVASLGLAMLTWAMVTGPGIRSYVRLAEQNPVPTKAITAALLNVVADLFCQVGVVLTSC